jgi:hypothetical protein
MAPEPVTPILSVEAVQEMLIWEEEMAVAVSFGWVWASP